MSASKNINANHVIVVHGGAGYHARSSEKQVKEGLRRACVAALSPEISEEPIGLHDLSVQSTVSAIKALEDDETFNAGYGSNLTIKGIVECDAALMTSDAHFGAVGAVSGAKYPVQVASAILKLSQTPDALGRVSPLLLVSQGAQAFAKGRADCHLVEAESMVSPRAKAEWEHWREIIQAGRPVAERERPAMQDTVGALTFYKTDAESAVTSAGVSSGGILMKLPGRIGEAAIYGAGCWASPRVAVSVSGTGEQIIRSSLAKALGQAVTRCFEQVSDSDPHTAIRGLLQSEFQGDPELNAGAIVLVNDGDDLTSDPVHLILYVAFTTESMAIGWFSKAMAKPRVKIVRQKQREDGSGIEGRSLCIEAFRVEV